MRPGAHLQRAGVRGAPFWTRFVFCNVLEGGALRSLVTPFCTEVTQQSKHLGTAYAWGQGVLRALVRVRLRGRARVRVRVCAFCRDDPPRSLYSCRRACYLFAVGLGLGRQRI